MFVRKTERWFATFAFLMQCGFVFAQNEVALTVNKQTDKSPSSLFLSYPIFNLERSVSKRSLDGDLVDKALNFNLGMKLQPVQGLSLIADAWQMQLSAGPSVEVDAKPTLYNDESSFRDFDLENPIIGDELESSGFDVGASYGWSTDRFGEFTLSSKTTYVDQFRNS